MDNQRDYDRFRKLIGRLCDTLGKPPSDDLFESWWKALRNARFEDIEARVDAFLAKADDGTRFPRPSQMRPEATAAPRIASDRDWIRDYWRSVIVHTLATQLRLTIAELEPLIVAHRHGLGESMLALLNEIDGIEKRSGARTPEMDLHAVNGAYNLAKEFNSAKRLAA